MKTTKNPEQWELFYEKFNQFKYTSEMKLHSEIEKSTENTKKIIAKTRKNIEKKSTPYDPNFTYNQILSISATGTAEVKISQLKAWKNKNILQLCLHNHENNNEYQFVVEMEPIHFSYYTTGSGDKFIKKTGGNILKISKTATPQSPAILKGHWGQKIYSFHYFAFLFGQSARNLPENLHHCLREFFETQWRQKNPYEN